MNQIPCWYNKYILYSFKRSSEIFAVSNILATSIKNTFGEFEIRILPNFVDLSVFSNYKLASDLNNQGSFIFLSIGNLNFYKGFDILLQSFAKAFISDKNVKLYIAGIGEIDKELKDITLKMGISDQVIFLGHLSQPEVREYLYLSDAFVLASRFETFGIVYIEAMACGKPVIATTCGGPEEFVDSECGYLVPKDNIHELATALVEMKKNKHNFNSEIIIQKISDKFDSKKLAAQLIEVYQTIL
jgi:glycosyltransferase involved in cell wall biosynthesis